MVGIPAGVPGQSYPGPSLLSNDHIRLVYLQPGSNGIVNCELITTSIDSAPPYEALSYTWGDPLSRKTINLKAQGSGDADEFLVTSSCFSALQRLQYRDKPRVLWIDALAIDQSNTTERNLQVSLMSKIYSRAAAVLVYLGEAADNSDLAVQFILECDNPSPGTTALTYIKSDVLAQALRRFFHRPWFSRVWVIQEVLLSTEKIVYCGEKVLPWSAIKNFNHYHTSTSSQSQLPYVVSTSEKSFRERTTEDSMLKALLDSRHCEATDPRDKVYSLLPLLDFFNKPLGLTPRYQDTLVQVYTDCAKALLADQGWKMLSAVQGGPGTNNLPSWVPDWSVPPMRHILATDWNLKNDHFWTDKTHLEVPDKPQVNICNPVGMGVKEPIPVLRVYGFRCGKIVRMGSTYIAGQTTVPFNEWWDLVETLFSEEPGINPEGIPTRSTNVFYSDEFWDEFYRFLSLARYLYSEDWGMEPGIEITGVLEDSSRSLKDYQFGVKWEDTVRQLALERGSGKSAADCTLPFTEIPFELAWLSLPSSYKARVVFGLKTCHLRRCFITDTGYFGLAPAEAEIGDHLYICVGAAIPFTLRAVQRESQKHGVNEFRLIGETYMENDAWNGLTQESKGEEFQPLDIL
ncbi:hypothetical protein NM208_g1252 [Fusarium decemcellulare]|uniref:Uncharacterized protein n=1 Tax=Fusarium decemcellulare TaxID=57161 RepID=A0ACC1SWW2_9HYPO|nr:hypothetical protein NM208_g1252 [Fusarium decemcellulare]